MKNLIIGMILETTFLSLAEAKGHVTFSRNKGDIKNCQTGNFFCNDGCTSAYKKGCK